MRRRGDGERKARLEIGLLEHCEHPAGIRNLELRVQVDLVVHRVHETVEPFAGIHVRRFGNHQQVVFRGEVGELDADAVGHFRGVEFLAVEHHAEDLVGYRVDEGGGPGPRTELHGGGGAEDFVAPGQVQADVVGLNGDEVGALTGFGARQVHAWQSGASRRVAVAGRQRSSPAL
ncbi:hypothetical protein D9M72_473580 [compost metagenome]